MEQMLLKMSPPKCPAFNVFQGKQQAFNVQGANWSTYLKEVVYAKGSPLLETLIQMQATLSIILNLIQI